MPFVVKRVGTLLAVRLLTRAANRFSGLGNPGPAELRFRGDGRHAVPTPEAVFGYRKHPTLSRWYAGPISIELAIALDGRQVTLRDGTIITLDFQTNVFGVFGAFNADFDGDGTLETAIPALAPEWPGWDQVNDELETGD